MKYYIGFGCGCKIPIDVAIKTKGKVNGKSRTICTCHKHGESWTEKISYCIDCGEELRCPYTQSSPRERCDTHKEAARLKTSRERNKLKCKHVKKKSTKKPKERKKIFQKKPRQKYCKLGVYCNDKLSTECWECKEFTPIFKHVDPKAMIMMLE